jgi:tetratricopeptide (TPR) repeat protein
MFSFLKRPLYVLSNKIRRDRRQDKRPEEKWTADFSSPEKSPFDIKSETSFDAYLEDRSLVLALKKNNCIAWIEAPDRHYEDQLIQARFRLDELGGYTAAGVMFRIVGDGTYYLALISTKGFFRLDAVRNNTPLALIGWTEMPAFANEPIVSPSAGSTDLEIIACGSHLVLLINGRWAAEADDPSIGGGTLAFVLASYEEPRRGAEEGQGRARARLETFSVDSRVSFVAEQYNKWNEGDNIPAGGRLRLAETFAAMGAAAPALTQIRRAWEQREKAARIFMATETESRSQKELLLAARLAFQLERYSEAGDFADACIDLGLKSAEGKEALTEKAKILYAEKKFGELQKFVSECIAFKDDDPVLHTLLGHVYRNLGEHEKAALSYDRAFELDRENGFLAENAANAYEALNKKGKALKRFLEAGRIFLTQDNYEDLGVLAPKLLALGANKRETHALAGKWAFGIEDFERAEAELALAEKLRRAQRPRPLPDPAVSFLRGLLLIRRDRRREAFRFLEEAAAAAPDYGLFHFRLAENRYLLTGDAKDPLLQKELGNALRLMPEDGWVHNFAAQIFLAGGDLSAAGEHLEKAAQTLGDVPAIRQNRGVFCYLRGSRDEALKILDAEKNDDPEGMLANCAGNLLVRSGDFEKADVFYRKALAADPDNPEYLSNRASCLIELGCFGQADEILAQARGRAPSPKILEMTGYVATKKGEYARAETACLEALEMDKDYVPALFSLGWIYSTGSRWDKLEGIIGRLEKIELTGDETKRLRELCRRFKDSVTRVINCASCRRSWRVPRNPEPSPAIRLYAMPPDEYPAGSCPECGRTYCIGCAKKHIDKSGRFICPGCHRNLKLSDEGLKKIICDWAASEIAAPRPCGASAKAAAKRKKTGNKAP